MEIDGFLSLHHPPLFLFTWTHFLSLCERHENPPTITQHPAHEREGIFQQVYSQWAALHR